MWTAETAHLGRQFTEPYMVDESTCQGMSALLQKEWATEEIHRLLEEICIMTQWVSSQIEKVIVAAGMCSGMQLI
jgi:hypothetical protein